MGQDHTLFTHSSEKQQEREWQKGKKIRVAGEIFIINLNHMALTISCIGFPDIPKHYTPTHIQDQFQFLFSAVSLAKINIQYKTLSSTTVPSFLPGDVLTSRDEHYLPAW